MIGLRLINETRHRYTDVLKNNCSHSSDYFAKHLAIAKYQVDAWSNYQIELENKLDELENDIED